MSKSLRHESQASHTEYLSLRPQFIEKTKLAIENKKEETARMVAASSEFNEGHKGGAKKPQQFNEVMKRTALDKPNSPASPSSAPEPGAKKEIKVTARDRVRS